MKRTLQIFFVSLTVIGATARSQAQSTALTYHGRLNNNGAPVTGAYDMQFSVHDAEAAGLPISGPVTANALDVVNGLFRARIDFGANVFTGPARWLEIQVRPAGNGEFQTLSPRQELTSAPYSIRAQSAGTATDVSNGSVVKSLNTLKDDVTLTAGANVTIAPNGNTLTISSTGPGGSVWGLNGANAYYTAGNAGIGTTTPPAPLSVFSSTASALDNTAVFFAPALGANASHVHYGLNGDWFIRSASGSGKVVLQDTGGNVGIGTQTPNHRLRISDGPLWTSDSWRGALELDTAAAIGWRANASGTHFGIGQSLFGLHVFTTTSQPATTGSPANYQVTIGNNGNVGIGTFASNAKLDVAGDAAATRLILRADPLAPANAAVLCGDPAVQYFVPYNTANARPLNLVVRDATVRQLTITGGADLAEPFKMSSDEIPKGAVVVIDEDKPGHLELSTESYDRRVAGVVSGANGIKPGISLQQEGAMEGGENVALSGRVYVQADATFGVIKPGDLLTTSDTPGYAMKVSDHVRAQGAVLGKAMTGLREGKGMVLVLVTLQ